MSGLPIGSRYASSPEADVSDADRDELTARLNQAYADGDLSLERYQELLDGLYQATKRGQLVPLASALPVRYQTTDPAGTDPGSALAPGQVNEPALNPQVNLARWLTIAAAGVGFALVAVLVLAVLL